MNLPNDFGFSDISRRRDFERRHVSAPIQPLGGPTLLDRLETTLSRYWITRNGGFLLCGLALALITIGLLGMGRV